jgi:hypothetical protein
VDDLVLQVESGGGLMGPTALPQQIPAFSLYGDGRFVLQGATTMIFPGPLLPPIMEMRLTPDGMRRLLDAARSAGLAGPDRRFELPGMFDATTTSFTVVTDRGRHVTSVYAFHEAGDAVGRMPPDERAARAALSTFESQLVDLRRVLGAEVGPEQPYVPAAMRVFVERAEGPVDPNVPPKIVAWPLEDLATFGEQVPALGAGVRCRVITGAELGTVMPQFRAATQVTRWVSRDTAYTLTLRPLLPDEDDCGRDQ